MTILLAQSQTNLQLGKVGLESEVADNEAVAEPRKQGTCTAGDSSPDPECKCVGNSSCQTFSFPDFGGFDPVIARSGELALKYANDTLAGNLEGARTSGALLSENSNALRSRIKRSKAKIKELIETEGRNKRKTGRKFQDPDLLAKKVARELLLKGGNSLRSRRRVKGSDLAKKTMGDLLGIDFFGYQDGLIADQIADLDGVRRRKRRRDTSSINESSGPALAKLEVAKKTILDESPIGSEDFEIGADEECEDVGGNDEFGDDEEALAILDGEDEEEGKKKKKPCIALDGFGDSDLEDEDIGDEEFGPYVIGPDGEKIYLFKRKMGIHPNSEERTIFYYISERYLRKRKSWLKKHRKRRR